MPLHLQCTVWLGALVICKIDIWQIVAAPSREFELSTICFSAVLKWIRVWPKSIFHSFWRFLFVETSFFASTLLTKRRGTLLKATETSRFKMAHPIPGNGWTAWWKETEFCNLPTVTSTGATVVFFILWLSIYPKQVLRVPPNNEMFIRSWNAPFQN